LFILPVHCTGDNKPREKTRPATPVTVTTAIQKDVPVQLRVIGKVEAYSAVAVRSLVEGELWKVYFNEGQDVQKDSLLLSIDPRPFEAALRHAEANLERDQALARQAEANLTRDLAQVTQAEANLAKNLAQAKNAEEQS
jgi:multidrug efflux system membrane fusion protein